MVFYEIESVTDVASSHRVIIYYIHGKLNFPDNYSTLFKKSETALDLLRKKNDDLLIIEVPHNSGQFKQFVDLYQPEVTGPITLFAVNNEGIPLLSETICEEINIFSAVERLCTTCHLKAIPKLDQYFTTKSKETFVEHSKLFSDDSEQLTGPTFSQEEINTKRLSSPINLENKQSVSQDHLTTRLQIRLPSGAREELQFSNDAKLQFVWIVIGTTFKIKDFDLKTYEHPIFSEDDYEQTLQHLDLCPRGVLIVVSKQVVPNNSFGGVSAFFQYNFHRLTSLSIYAFQYIRGLLFVFWNYLFRSNNSSTFKRQGREEIRSSSDRPNSNKSSSYHTSKKYVPKNVGNNIHTLHRKDDSDDENNSYNGNSTQQK